MFLLSTWNSAAFSQDLFTVLVWWRRSTFWWPDRNIEEGVSKSIRTCRLEQELQTVELSATRCSCLAILWVSLMSFAAITLCVASQRGFIVVSIYFFIDSVRKLLNTPSYMYIFPAFISKPTWLLSLHTVFMFGLINWRYQHG